jgi:RNA-directed DNA polymerase
MMLACKGNISLILANIYLHYALNKWVVEWRLHESRRGEGIIRYADDFVMGLQYQDDGERFLRAAEKRLDDVKPSINANKTYLIEFGRLAKNNREQRGVGKPNSFDFLALLISAQSAETMASPS